MEELKHCVLDQLDAFSAEAVAIRQYILAKTCSSTMLKIVTEHLSYLESCAQKIKSSRMQQERDSEAAEPEAEIKFDACPGWLHSLKDKCYEKLYEGDWHATKICWRGTYRLACHLTILESLLPLYINPDGISFSTLQASMELADHGMIMGAELSSWTMYGESSLSDPRPVSLSLLASRLHASLVEKHPLQAPTQFPGVRDVTSFCPTYSPRTSFPVERMEYPSMEEFVLTQDMRTPTVIEGAVDNWPALKKWADPSYIMRVAGYRTVPVEMGRDYRSNDWSQKMMTIEKFLRTQMLGNAESEIGYLAQHPLFDQIPELQRDVIEPDFCSMSSDSVLKVNAWFGPEGTISPLHHDPHDNLLVQVVGAKFVRLYAPSQTRNLYPCDGMLYNNSSVDAEDPNFSKFPRFAKAACQDVILRAGEMLYIPKGYWHYVRSLTPSFSVSYWFNTF